MRMVLVNVDILVGAHSESWIVVDKRRQRRARCGRHSNATKRRMNERHRSDKAEKNHSNKHPHSESLLQQKGHKSKSFNANPFFLLTEELSAKRRSTEWRAAQKMPKIVWVEQILKELDRLNTHTADYTLTRITQTYTHRGAHTLHTSIEWKTHLKLPDI